MGIIKATTSAVGGGLADQWLEIIEPNNLTDQTVMTEGIAVRKDDKRNANKKGSSGVITDGSVIHVYPNTMMLLVEGGKIVDYSAEPGHYIVKNDQAPSMFSGNLKEAIAESFNRIKFGGVSPQNQKVIYINLQEIKGIKFGTSSPLNYFDNFYNAELFLRAHGNYSLKITDPILFYSEVLPKSSSRVTIDEINEQYLAEFLTALQATINQMSADGERISFVPSKSMELSKYMANVLDDEWRANRGMEIVSVAVSSISYTDDSKDLINMRNKGAMLGDPSIREGFVQGSVASGLEAAGSNPGGSAATYMGMGAGMNAGGNFMGQASQSNQQQMQQQAQQKENTWTCPKDGTANTGNFCSDCGEPKPTANATTGIQMKCGACNAVVTITSAMPKFCPECGAPFQGLPL